MLTAAKVRTVSKPGVYTDGPGRYGLTMTAKESGYGGLRKVWTQRLTVDGRRTMVGLGKVEFVSLAEARTMAFENAKAAARGEPLPHGGTRRRGARAARTVPTFAEAMNSYIKLQSSGWKPTSRNEGNWRSSLAHAKAIHDRPVDAVTADDVVGIVSRLIEFGKAPLARSVRQRIRSVLDWAIASGHRTGPNPANGELDAVLPKSNHKAKHHEAVPVDEVAGVLAKIAAIDAPTWHGMKGAMQLCILTACRTKEAIWANWEEFDFDTKTWTIPASRMKAGKVHRVPLSDAALDVLQEARERTHGKGLVFRAPRGGRLNEKALREVMKRVGSDATPHGLRGSFKSWAMEAGIARDVTEFSLAHHSHMSDVEVSYVRTDLLEQRRPVIQAWADHVTARDS